MERNSALRGEESILGGGRLSRAPGRWAGPCVAVDLPAGSGLRWVRSGWERRSWAPGARPELVCVSSLQNSLTFATPGL